jgi:hypothetical protein
VHPCRRCLFQFPHNVRQAMGRLESDKQVYVIGHPTDPFRKPAQSPNRPPKYS